MLWDRSVGSWTPLPKARETFRDGGILSAGAMGHPRGTPGSAGSPPAHPARGSLPGSPLGAAVGISWGSPWGSPLSVGFCLLWTGLWGCRWVPFSFSLRGDLDESSLKAPSKRCSLQPGMCLGGQDLESFPHGHRGRVVHTHGLGCALKTRALKMCAVVLHHTLSCCLPLIPPCPSASAAGESVW